MPIEKHLGNQTPPTTRRNFLKWGMLTAAGLALPGQALARIARPVQGEKTLSFYNTHTGETLKQAVFWAEGDFYRETLKDINYILRDHRADKVHRMDVELLDLLYGLRRTLETDRPFHVISGYRSPQTNQLLRQKGSGVAKKSLHMQGRAIDLRVPGFTTAQLRKAARSLQAGGVGYYPESRFVHVDTGRVRFW